MGLGQGVRFFQCTVCSPLDLAWGGEKGMKLIFLLKYLFKISPLQKCCCTNSHSVKVSHILTNNVLIISGKTLKKATIKRPVQKHDWFTVTLSRNNCSTSSIMTSTSTVHQQPRRAREILKMLFTFW